MKLDIACVRDILLFVESLPFNSVATIDTLHEAYPQYTEEIITYNCLKLIEAGYIDGMTASMMRSYLPGIKCITCMTYEGHQFLETIRPETVFEKTKNTLSAIGTGSFAIAKEIGTSLLTELVHLALNM